MKMEEKYYYLKVGKASDLKDEKERKIYRALEILPGVLAWVTLALVIFLSWAAPMFIAFFIITFDVYWFLKTIFLSLHLRVGFNKTKDNIKIDWMERLKTEKTGWESFYHLIVLPVYKEGIDIIAPTMDAILSTNYPKNKMIIVFAIEARAGKQMEDLAGEVEQ